VPDDAIIESSWFVGGAVDPPSAFGESVVGEVELRFGSVADAFGGKNSASVDPGEVVPLAPAPSGVVGDPVWAFPSCGESGSVEVPLPEDCWLEASCRSGDGFFVVFAV
jgi:hypothetical protein